MSYEKGRPYTVTFLGAGVIGQALLSAYFASIKPETAPAKIIACVQYEVDAKELLVTYKDKTGSIKFESSHGRKLNAKAVEEADVVIIATKPYITGQALDDLKADGVDLHDKLFISMAAGWTISQLQSATTSNHVSRVMTNTPARYQYGTAVISHSGSVTEDQRQLILDLVSPIGKVVELPEKNMDAATGLVGSGPAFMLLVLEGLIESGVSLGIPYEESRQCALKVMEGTAKMAELSGSHPGELKSQICTPGGTTIAGLVEMEAQGVKYGVIRGVQKAAERASELGKSN